MKPNQSSQKMRSFITDIQTQHLLMISMVGIADKNGVNQQSCYKHPLRTKGKVHFEPRFGGRPRVFGGEVEHSSPAFGDGKSPGCCWGREGYGLVWRRSDGS